MAAANVASWLSTCRTHHHKQIHLIFPKSLCDLLMQIYCHTDSAYFCPEHQTTIWLLGLASLTEVTLLPSLKSHHVVFGVAGVSSRSETTFESECLWRLRLAALLMCCSPGPDSTERRGHCSTAGRICRHNWCVARELKLCRKSFQETYAL